MDLSIQLKLRKFGDRYVSLMLSVLVEVKCVHLELRLELCALVWSEAC